MGRRASRLAFGAALLAALLPSGAATSGAATASQCTRGQLEVGLAWTNGCAAGTCGVVFLIANKGASACALDGYARLGVYTGGRPPRPIRIIRGGSGYWAARAPREVVIPSRGTASFGISFGDAMNQQMGNRPACDVQSIYVTLPVVHEGLESNFETTVNFNVCFSNFAIAETPIEAGPYPAAP